MSTSLNETAHFHLVGVQYPPLPAGGYNSFHMLLPVLVGRRLTLVCAKYFIVRKSSQIFTIYCDPTGKW